MKDLKQYFPESIFLTTITTVFQKKIFQGFADLKKCRIFAVKIIEYSMGFLGLKVRLGLFPGAAQIERKRAKLLADYQQYCEYAKSDELKRFNELSKYVKSAEYEEFVNNPESDPQKAKALQQELTTLQKSKQLKQYFQNKANEGRFAPIVEWKLVFSDEFEGGRLNADTWLTHYYGAEKGIKQSYSLWGDLQCNTEGKNVKLSDSKAIIETRKEPEKGLVWNPMLGFMPVDFPYTSGVINTANSFRTTYGKIEAKVKVPKGNAYHAFWLAGEGVLPHVNIFNFVGKRFYFGNFWGKKGANSSESSDVSKLTGAFAGRSNIFTLEWNKGSLTWSINGEVVKTSIIGVPSQPLYLAFGSGVKSGKRKLSQPVSLEIDWVRCYTKQKHN